MSGPTNASSSGGGGGGIRDVGTVTGGMAIMNFDEKTKPYTRQDLMLFLQDYEKNLNEQEMRLLEKGMAATFIGMPLAFFLGWKLSSRFNWRRVQKVVPYTWVPTAGKAVFGLTAMTIPYIAVQQWFVTSVLAMDNSSNLSFHLKRLMLTQRNGMMFARTATREVTREEQDRYSQEAARHTIENRMAARPQSNGGMDINLALTNQAMTPVAQTGYKPMPTQKALLLVVVLVVCATPASAFFQFQFDPSQQQQQRRQQVEQEKFEEIDYYGVLELKRETATEKDIRKQFRELSRKFHPDMNKSEDAKKKYKDITRANEVLSDKRKRKMFDMRGEAGVRLLEKSDREESNGQQQHMFNPLAQLMGGGGMGRNQFKGPNKDITVQVKLDDIYNGRAVVIKTNKQEVCKSCKGSGAEHGSGTTACGQCNGMGMVVQRIQIAPNMIQQVQQPCPACQGSGSVARHKCKSCGGKRLKTAVEKLTVHIEKGIPQGHKITYEMEADETPDQIPGDLIVTVDTHSHPTFSRRRNNVDLDATLTISIKEALLGFTRQLEHMDGRRITVAQHDVITPFGTVIRIPGEGMPHHNVPSERGDLYVRVEYELPKIMTEAQREAIDELFED